jgi:RNA polymerase sigma-70 factor, ECF subfamily
MTRNIETPSFRDLYEANRSRVQRLLARLVGPQDAEDLMQAVFAKAAQALPGFRGDAETSTWLYRIAANVASDWLHSGAARRAKLTVPLGEGDNEETRAAIIGVAEADRRPSPEDELSQKNLHDCMRVEIAKLPAAHREVMMLSALGGLSDEEIAQTLDISKGNAKVRLHRARQEFREIIAARCDFYKTELSCKPSSADCCAPSTAADGDCSRRSRPVSPMRKQ